MRLYMHMVMNVTHISKYIFLITQGHTLGIHDNKCYPYIFRYTICD